MKTYTNYQLYRTNPKLSGQIKLNLVINNDMHGMSISSFQLLPLSNNSLNIQPIKTNVLKHTHIYNLKRYYEINRLHFYDDIEGLDNQFKNDENIIDKGVDMYPTTYNMGCKRISYNRNKKQFEFLCPLWLEKVENSIEFKFNVYSTKKDQNNQNSNKSIISSKSLILNISEKTDYHETNDSTHHNVENYISNYLYSAGIFNGINNVGEILFSKNEFLNTTTILLNGLCLSDSKQLKLIHTLNSFNEISSLYETDNEILSKYIDNTVICPQLINFNLSFNIEDIISKYVSDLMSNSNCAPVGIEVEVYVDGSKLEMRDFDTEYDYIKKQLIYDTDKSIDEYIDAKEKHNKNVYNVYGSTQNHNNIYDSTCHWSLSDNDEYMVNTFPGFEAITIVNEGNDIVEYYNSYQYNDTPSIDNSGDPIYGDCSTRWINIKHIFGWDQLYKYIRYTNTFKFDGSYIPSSNEAFINNIKYFNIPNELHNTYILGIVTNKENITRLFEVYKCVPLYIDDKYNGEIYVCKKDDLLMLITTDEKYLTFKRVLSMIKYNFNSIKDKIDILIYLEELMTTSITDLKVVLFNDVLYHCLRYDGKIKPKFTSKSSTLRYIDIIRNGAEKSNSIKSLSDWEYNNVPLVNICINNINEETHIINTDNEYSWFNTNNCMSLYPEIIFTATINVTSFITDANIYKNIAEYYLNIDKAINVSIVEKITNVYKLDASSSDYSNLLSYIIKLYSITFEWDFVENDPKNYNVSIVMKLR